MKPVDKPSKPIHGPTPRAWRCPTPPLDQDQQQLSRPRSRARNGRRIPSPHSGHCTPSAAAAALAATAPVAAGGEGGRRDCGGREGGKESRGRRSCGR